MFIGINRLDMLSYVCDTTSISISSYKYMKYFRYKYEPYKGYIPYDKVRVGQEPYETGASSTLKEMLKSIFTMYDGKKCKSMLYDIDTVIKSDMEKSDYEQEDKKVKPYYMNINRDGIDCFVHRWNWKLKNK